MFWQHRMSADTAAGLARQHFRAFSVSGCRTCDGPCCRDCAAEEGYMRHTEATLADVERLKAAHGFDPVHGWRGPGGCRLPMHERSPTCTLFYCGVGRSGFPGGSNPAGDLPPAQRRAVARQVVRLKRAFEQC